MSRLAKELSWAIPTSTKINRGKKSLRDLWEYAVTKGYSKVIIIETWKGNPGKILFTEPGYKTLSILGEAYIGGVKLLVDQKNRERRIVSTLSGEGGGDLYRFLEAYLDLPLHDPRRSGVEASLHVEEGEERRIVFRHGEEELYPVIRVRRWRGVDIERESS